MARDITLFSYFRSSCSYRVRIALYLKKIPFVYKPVHLLKDEQFQADFLQINPFAAVPCLVVREKAVKEKAVTEKQAVKFLGQSLPVILYLDALYPEPPLLPQEPFQRAEILSVCEMINSSIQPLHNLRVLKAVEGKLKGDRIKWARGWIQEGLSALESFLKPRAGRFSFGDSLTMADLFIEPQLESARRFQAALKPFPVLNRVSDSCRRLEAFQKARPADQPDAPA